MPKLLISGIDITHSRLVELAKLADQAKPFYDWIEKQFQLALGTNSDLNTNLVQASVEQLQIAIKASYMPADTTNLPILFDGTGRPYTHRKACFYFFAWIIRDAPQQRLSNPIRDVLKQIGGSLIDAQITVLAHLIIEYRSHVKTFEWVAIREVFIDRLEGSRRSLKGHEKETITRTALLEAIQTFYGNHGHYGIFTKVEINAKQIKINNETFDVSANLFGAGSEVKRRILIPVKTRETQGGGHSHLFSRDLTTALSSLLPTDIIIVIIVAKSWSAREIEALIGRINHLIIMELSPEEFSTFPEAAQLELNEFIKQVLQGMV
jgi:hypothetical protein